MKAALLLLATLITVNQAQALTCTLNRENQKEKSTFDVTVFEGLQIASGANEMIAIKPSGEVIRNFTLDTMRDWKTLDRSIFVFASQDAEGTAIGFGKIDLRQTDNLLSISALATLTGKMQSGQALVATDFGQKLSLVCIQ